MGQNKLFRFEALKSFPNVLQYPEGIKGKWSEFFKNEQPIVLELACGKGEYSNGLAALEPSKNYIGIDIKGNRIYIGAKQAMNAGRQNVAFLRCQIQQLADYFEQGEATEIWIIFPDPFLKDGKAKNRLTHGRFLKIYQEILPPGAFIHLKTDSEELYQFTLESIAENNCVLHEKMEDIYGNGKATGVLSIQTFYEKMHLAEGRKINYLRFSLPEKTIPLPPRKKKENAG